MAKNQIGIGALRGMASRMAAPPMPGLRQLRPATKRRGPLSTMMGMATGGTPGGQDDVVPAMLAPGEYVFDAETVAALGDGSNEAGAAKLDAMRVKIRSHKRRGPLSKIPPRAKAPEQYLRSKR